jgi:chorismate synthase
VGYNPFRVQVKHRGDLAIVIAAVVVVALLVAWALFGS